MFPNISYDAKGDGRLNQYKNIFRRVKLTAQTQIVDFDYYDVQDGESPEIIAHKYYKDVGLHWTILVANNIVDYYHDWTMSMQTFEQYITEKYDNPAGIHHYEINATSGDTTNKLIVASDTDGATPVTNYEYEQTLNDNKRRIRILDRSFVSKFTDEFRNLIRR